MGIDCKTVQHVKIYIPCNFEVNLITHLGVIALFSSKYIFFNTFRLIFKNKMGIGIYFKIAGWVDLDMLHIFAI
jgi:hypothetical protein